MNVQQQCEARFISDQHYVFRSLMNRVWVIFWLVPFCMWPQSWVCLPFIINVREILVVHLHRHLVHMRQLFDLFQLNSTHTYASDILALLVQVAV